MASLHYARLNESLKASCLEDSIEFENGIKTVEKIQKAKLLDLIRKNQNTEFGKKYRFKNIQGIDDFRRAVPILTHQDYQEFIVKIMDGQQEVLTSEPVLILEPTSGSVAPSKLIPYTESLRREFRKGISPWLYDLLSNHSEIMGGSFYWSITPAMHEEKTTNGGLKIGFGNDDAYFTNTQQRLISQLTAVPFNVSRIQDINNFQLETLKHLLENKDLAFISVWNPTFLSLLFKPLISNKDNLLARIKSPDRVRELSDIFSSGDDKQKMFKRIWPNLSLISCWTDGNASPYVDPVKKLFPEVEIQGKGLIATEGFVSLPLLGYKGSALSINSHFFEFKQKDKEFTRLAHELEKGEKYEVIITTGGGFYRYNLEDTVEVVGFREQCPLIKFLGRSNRVSDLFGEKLNETHVSDALYSSLRETGISPNFCMVAPEELQGEQGHAYTVFIEPNEVLRGQKDRLSNFVKEFDVKLQENYHYKYCRKLGQLLIPRIFIINEGAENKSASEIYLEVCSSRGQKIGAVKPALLNSTKGWSKEFPGYFVKSD